MAFAYYARLNRRQKALYRRSDAIHTVPLPDSEALRPLVPELQAALRREERRRIEAICQQITDGIGQRLDLPPCRVKIHAVRPSDEHGELHGLYRPEEDGASALIALWMRTAQRKKVVAFRTFLRTLLHEICHHLDYEHFGLAETFHTEGFYKRESSLFHQLMAEQ